MFGKQKVATMLAEFLGTGILTLLVLSVQRSTIGVPFFVAIIAGLTLTAMVFALGNASGAVLNPAIAIAMWTARKLSTMATVIYVIFELLGAWAAYYLYGYLVHNKVVAIGGHFNGRILAAEAVGAGILAFVWAASSYQKWARNTKAPVVGIALMISMVAASSAGIGLVNPALALGVHAWVWGTYVLGPILGAVIGFNLFGQLFTTDKELADAGGSIGASVASATKSTSAKSTTKKTTVKKKTTKKK